MLHKFVWPGMRKDVVQWTLSCLQCQRSKINRHTKNSFQQFVVPNQWFQQIHLDLVGPLTVSHGYRYILTMIDSYSRWLEAVLTDHQIAATMVQAFYTNSVSRFDPPKVITADQDTQFKSVLFGGLTKLFNRKRSRTEPYHPTANGLVERWHPAL